MRDHATTRQHESYSAQGSPAVCNRAITFVPMTRHCARPGCSESAAATLTYDYSGGTAWMDKLAPEPHPMSHDLCTGHADRLSVPRGWRLEDRRVVESLTPWSALAAS